MHQASDERGGGGGGGGERSERFTVSESKGDESIE